MQKFSLERVNDRNLHVKYADKTLVALTRIENSDVEEWRGVLDVSVDELRSAMQALSYATKKIPNLEIMQIDIPIHKSQEYQHYICQQLTTTGTTDYFRAGFVPGNYSDYMMETFPEFLTKFRQLSVANRDALKLQMRDYCLVTKLYWFDVNMRLEKAMTEVSSFNAVTLGDGRNMLFPSKRARTPMLQLRQKPFRVYRGPSYADGRIVTLKNGISLIPISRYSEGMSGGLYFNKDNTKFCGTFYYWEPQSEVYLSVLKERMIYTVNKIGAALQLLDWDAELSPAVTEFLKEKLDQVLESFLDMMELDITEKNKRQLKTYSRDLQTSFPLTEDLKVPGTNDYISNLYAVEDPLDQPICLAAKELQIDVIFLGRQAGKHRVVSEILDTRTRQESVESLAWRVL